MAISWLFWFVVGVVVSYSYTAHWRRTHITNEDAGREGTVIQRWIDERGYGWMSIYLPSTVTKPPKLVILRGERLEYARVGEGIRILEDRLLMRIV